MHKNYLCERSREAARTEVHGLHEERGLRRTSADEVSTVTRILCTVVTLPEMRFLAKFGGKSGQFVQPVKVQNKTRCLLVSVRVVQNKSCFYQK